MANDDKRQASAAKPRFTSIPPMPLLEIGMAFETGVEKHGGKCSWRDISPPPDSDTYLNAAWRHILAWMDGLDADPESGLHPLAHACASLMILLDSVQSGILDDRRAVRNIPVNTSGTPGTKEETVR